MRSLSSRPHNNHKQQVPRPAASGARSVRTRVWSATKFLFYQLRFVPALASWAILVLLKGLLFLFYQVTLLPALASWVIFVLLKGLFIVALVMFLLSWAYDEDSITIAAFTDISASPAETATPTHTSLGQFVADALTFELDRISQLQALKNPWSSPEQIGSPKVTTPEAYERVGGISVSGIELPVGELVLALKSILPHVNQRQAITGSIQRLSADERSRMRIIARLEEDGKILKHWEVDQDPNTEGDIVDLVRDLAFQISWSILNDIGTRSYYSFQHYIHGVELFRKYKDTGDENHFHRAEQKLLDALLENPEYVRAHFFLGILYSWRFYYEKHPETSEQFTQQSTTAFQGMEGLYTSSGYDPKALANYGLGLIAHRRYMKGKQEHKDGYILDVGAKEKLDLWLREAEYFYTKALILDQDLHFARAARALVYKERALVYKELNFIGHAIQEFEESLRQERVEEECRKRNGSAKDWSQKQIDQLEEQRSRMEEEYRRVGVKGQDTTNQHQERGFDNRHIIPRLLAIFRWSSSQDACT